MSFEIKIIPSSQTLPIRQKAMWPNQPLAFVQLDADEKGKHLGLFVEGQLVAVVSLFIAHQEAQFRKFATLPEFQGQGYGTHLLRRLLELVQQQNCAKVWCNARMDKTNFYHKFGLKETDRQFNRAGIQYVVMEKVLNKSRSTSVQ